MTTTKRAVVIGCNALGLNEAALDAALTARWLRERLGWQDVHVLTGQSITPAQLLEVPAMLHGADVALLYYTGHGYRRRDAAGRPETGLYLGEPVAHSWIMRNVIVPARDTTRYLVRAYDSCYAGGTLKLRAPSGAQAKARIKGLTLSAGLPGETEPEHYKPVDDGDVVIAASSARQFAYGMFAGGWEEMYWPLNTDGCSLFTHCLWPSVQYFHGLSLRKAASATQYRTRNLLEAWGTGAGWLMSPPIRYPVPSLVFRMARTIPDNLLTL